MLTHSIENKFSIGLEVRSLAPRSPRANLIGIKIDAHVADFYENFIV